MADKHTYLVVAFTFGAIGLLHSTRIARTTTFRAADREQQMTEFQIKQSDVVNGNYIMFGTRNCRSNRILTHSLMLKAWTTHHLEILKVLSLTFNRVPATGDVSWLSLPLSFTSRSSTARYC
jgi:hypothetical protein